jgi:hypothetical protein
VCCGKGAEWPASRWLCVVQCCRLAHTRVCTPCRPAQAANCCAAALPQVPVFRFLVAYRRLQCIIFCLLPVADGCTMASAVLQNLVLLHHEGWSPCWRGAGSPAAPPVLLLPGTCCHQTDGNFGPLSLMPCIRGAVCSAVCRVYFTAVVVGILIGPHCSGHHGERLIGRVVQGPRGRV